MKKFMTIAGAAMLLSGTSAFAQVSDSDPVADTVAEAGIPPVDAEVGAEATTEMPAAEAPAETTTTETPSASAGAETATSFTDAQIDSYVTAAMSVQEMQADTALDAAAKQQRAGEILAESGLDADTFNSISDAVQSDPSVAERVQLALANRQGSPGA